MKRSLVVFSLFGIGLFCLVLAWYVQYEFSHTKALAQLITYENRTKNARYGIFSTIPESTGEVLSAVVIHDARPAIITQFYQSYGSPLAPYAAEIVADADKYNIDYRLLPAISMQESSGGKIIPDNSYNAWGFAITETQTLRFASWDQAIDTVSRGLARGYISQGLRTPEQIMTKYTPASIPKGGAWAKGVRYFMEQMP